ncbi:hypothetical protein BT69DRAFT_1288758 [Atractiella rhizophila]|nr:hypothetical protein BT69DRAFT_1288758 [Atractiella rhizophila]
MDDGVVTGPMVADSPSARVGGAGKSVCLDTLRCERMQWSMPQPLAELQRRKWSEAKNRVQWGGHDSAQQLGSFVQVSI